MTTGTVDGVPEDVTWREGAWLGHLTGVGSAGRADAHWMGVWMGAKPRSQYWMGHWKGSPVPT